MPKSGLTKMSNLGPFLLYQTTPFAFRQPWALLPLLGRDVEGQSQDLTLLTYLATLVFSLILILLPTLFATVAFIFFHHVSHWR